MTTQNRNTEKRARRARRQGMTIEEMLRDMTTEELAENVRRGGPAAVREQRRREYAFQLPPNGHSDLERMAMVEATIPDWRI